MKYCSLLLAALSLTAGFAADAQNPDPTAPRRRAWMDAPAEQKALWERHKAALKILDISQETRRHVVIAQGTPQEYHAHPTTAMLADNRTIIAVWNLGHGGHGGPLARSEDGGLTCPTAPLWRRPTRLIAKTTVAARL